MAAHLRSTFQFSAFAHINNAITTTEVMGIAIRCILEQDIFDIPLMEGKSLAMAYLGDQGNEPAEETGPSDNVIAIDFGNNKPQIPPSSAPSSGESLLAILDPFLAEAGSDDWHEAAEGLAAVRGILLKLNNGAKITTAPDFGLGGDDDEDLAEGVRYDLEELEQILVAAQKACCGFYLTFAV
ncbi:MAG TPA: hypothetical protein VFC07_11750 [Verrucomicrobiae bacterium]|nr:hypothetical protein [Verrucomicrobiae bacterium]